MAIGAYNQRSGSAVGKLFAKLDLIPALYVVHLEGFGQGQRITFAPTLLQLPRSLLCQQIAD